MNEKSQTESGSGAGGGVGGEDLSLEDRLRRLDEIVAALEGGEVELERGLALFEEGVKHIRATERLLATAELRVEELVGGEGEDPVVREFEGEENG